MKLKLKRILRKAKLKTLKTLKYLNINGNTSMATIFQTLANFLLDYHLYIIIFILSILILLNKKDIQKEPLLLDTNFIKQKFVSSLAAKQENLTESEIVHRLRYFETSLKNTMNKISKQEKRLILKKSSSLSGGVDITQEVCELLEFKNCDAYEGE